MECVAEEDAGRRVEVVVEVAVRGGGHLAPRRRSCPIAGRVDAGVHPVRSSDDADEDDQEGAPVAVEVIAAGGG